MSDIDFSEVEKAMERVRQSPEFQAMIAWANKVNRVAEEATHSFAQAFTPAFKALSDAYMELENARLEKLYKRTYGWRKKKGLVK